jgi:hypothetical protein
MTPIFQYLPFPWFLSLRRKRRGPCDLRHYWRIRLPMQATVAAERHGLDKRVITARNPSTSGFHSCNSGLGPYCDMGRIDPCIPLQFPSRCARRQLSDAGIAT